VLFCVTFVTYVVPYREKWSDDWTGVLEKFFKLAYPSVTYTHVQTSPLLDYGCDELLAGLGVADVAGDFYEALLGFFFAAEALGCFF